MSEHAVLIEQESEIGLVTLNRPDRANTLNDQLISEFQGGLLELSNNSDIRAIVITGAGRHFCGGADLRAKRSQRRHTYEPGLDISWVAQPVIAAINGAAMGGGCEIALGCDFRFISTEAKIGLTEIRFGALPAGGGTVLLPRLVGLAHAKRLIYSGEPIDADEALHIGLVDRVCAPDALVAEATDYARQLSVHAPFAMRTAKTLLNQSLEIDPATARRLERQMIRGMATSEEAKAAREDAAKRMATYANIFSKPDAD